MNLRQNIAARLTARQKTLGLLICAGIILFLISLPRPAAVVPVATPETEFIAAATRARNAWVGAPNDLARLGMRQARAAALCRALPSGTATGWTGWISDIEPNGLPDLAGNATARIVISLTDHLTLSTPTSPLLNAPGTMAEAGTPVYAAARGLVIGQRIRFSGRFLPSGTDCMTEESFTADGSMRNPDFKFVLTALAANTQS
jgi:hypothetical protein